ncbi:hypothetical protein HAV15_010017 [Penicillium sp. str. |nr:hypothetical protein HAV15_010017 [Penicillium sp. str. \
MANRTLAQELRNSGRLQMPRQCILFARGLLMSLMLGLELKVDDIIIRSVKTYKAERERRTAEPARIKRTQTHLVPQGLDITTPGFMRLPCAVRLWPQIMGKIQGRADATRHRMASHATTTMASRTAPHRKTTYVEETTSESPLIDDCLVIVKEHRRNKWVIVQGDREAVWNSQSWNMYFSALRAKGRKGNADEYRGQDAVDIIRYTAKHWGHGTDKMRGKGVMQCDGNIKTGDQGVHTTTSFVRRGCQSPRPAGTSDDATAHQQFLDDVNDQLQLIFTHLEPNKLSIFESV